MNEIRRIVCPIEDTPAARLALHHAVALAAAHGAELGVLLSSGEQVTGAYLTPEAAAIAVQLATEQSAARRAAAAALFAQLQAASGPPLHLLESALPPVEALLAAARRADLLVVAQPDPAHPGGLGVAAAARLLVGAGAPVLFVPHIGSVAAPAGAPGRALVAWSDTRESARALRDALPLLRRASAVELISFRHAGDEGDDGAETALAEVAAHLGRHGVPASCTVRRSREPSIGERMRRGWIADASIAESLLSHAADVDAGLIVMGGYGHARAWELALGGVTRTLLKSMTVPVFMSH